MNIKKHSSLLAGFLAALMLMGSLASCNTDPVETTGSEGTSVTETDSGSERETDSGTKTESGSETATETETEEETLYYDTTPLTLTKTEDLFPDYKAYEELKSFTLAPLQIKVEGESYDHTNLPLANASGGDYSGGTLLRSLTGFANLKDGWDVAYTVEFTFTVPEEAYYEIQAVTHQVKANYTSDYSVAVDGKQISDADSCSMVKAISYPFDPQLMKLYSYGSVYLTAGEHTLVFTLDNEDSKASQNRTSFFLDYFTLDKKTSVSEGIEIDYDAEIKGEDSELLLSAAKVDVFDCRYPISVQINHLFKEAGEVGYSVTDYFGNKLCEGKLSGKAGELISLTRGLKGHPTGYFTVNVGDKVYPYVVTPSFENRTLEDSPFAMDFASTYLVKNVDNVEALASAARLAGVTWVRERAQWASFEKQKGVYTFSGVEAHFRAIDKTGLKILAMLEAAPTWAVSDLNSTNRAGGYLNNQLSIYEMTKAMAAYYKGIVDAWELANEPDGGRSETAEQYAAWFKAAALGVAAGDPNVIISHAGMCVPDSHHTYVDLALANGIMNYSQIFNYHSHTPQASNWHTPKFTNFLPTQMNSATTLYETLSKPTWVTEAGMKIMTTVPTQKHLLNQARYTVTSTAQSLSLGNEKHFWFVLSPYVEAGGDFGTFSSSLEPYPSLAAEAVMTDILGEARYLGDIPGIQNYSYASGLLFHTGSRMVAVLWTFDPGLKYTYTFASDLPVIVTDMMGNQTLIEPENGKISVQYSGDPIYITFNTPITDLYAQKAVAAEIEPLTFTPSDRIIMTPEFEGYDINDTDTKKYGHVLKDGMTVKVRIGNYNDFAITGSVSAEIPGYEVKGTDQVVTVQPFTEEFITLTLKKTGDDSLRDFVTFLGSFGEYSSYTVAQVRSENKVTEQSVTFFSAKDGREYQASRLATVDARVKNVEGTPVVYVDGQPYDKFVMKDGTIKVTLEGIPAGKHIITAAIRTPGGDYVAGSITLRFDGEIYIFYPIP